MWVLWPRRIGSICATALGVIVTPRQPRLASSSTAQISDNALVLPGKRPMILVRRRTLDERALQQVRAAGPLAVLQREAQVRDELVDVLVDRLHRRGVGAAVVAGQGQQGGLRLAGRHGVVEDLPVAGLNLAM
jgi:hypothetical protein